MRLEVIRSGNHIIVRTDDGEVRLDVERTLALVEGAKRMLNGDSESRLVDAKNLELRDIGDMVELDLLFDRRSHVDDHTYKLSKEQLSLFVHGLERAANE